MKKLIALTQLALNSNQQLPFSIYFCKRKQSLRHVPIFNPVAVFVLSGTKTLSGEMQAVCQQGQFLFLGENPQVTLSNIPGDEDYLALFIEFEYQDFDKLQATTHSADRFLVGDMNSAIIKSITQFIEWSQVSPQEMWDIRRRELLQLLCFYGHQEIISMVSKPKINHQIIDVINADMTYRWDIKNVSHKLAMSESTLRRKLKAEGTGFRDLHTQVKLSRGMHLLQTTGDSISIISEKCGYQSQSRFTERFKQRFGVTPAKLRQNKLNENS